MGKIRYVHKHPSYYRWHNAKRRCTDPTNPAWPGYGGRGIKFYKEWEDPSTFIRYIHNLPNAGMPGYSLDRINNDGHYEPGNIRWATRHEQSINRRTARTSPTGIKGVYQRSDTLKWVSDYTYKGNRISRCFKTKEEAIIQRKKWKLEEK